MTQTSTGKIIEVYTHIYIVECSDEDLQTPFRVTYQGETQEEAMRKVYEEHVHFYWWEDFDGIPEPDDWKEAFTTYWGGADLTSRADERLYYFMIKSEITLPEVNDAS